WDLPADFPPLKTLETFSTNLPVQFTSFVGREKQIAEIKRLLTTPGPMKLIVGDRAEGQGRLVTLTGSGGTGKTRLALQAAADVLEAFRDGVWLIELAPLADPALVPQTVAATLSLPEAQGRTPLLNLQDYLRSKQLLLVLDNCEHLIDTCAEIAEALLRACPT